MATNVKIASDISRVASLNAIFLKSAVIESKLSPSEVPERININQGHRADYTLSSYDESVRILALVDYRLEVFEKGNSEGDTNLARLEATFALDYRLPPDARFNKHQMDCFVELNGPFNSWPFWRELVQTAMARIGLGSITIPLFRPIVREIELSSDSVHDDEQNEN